VAASSAFVLDTRNPLSRRSDVVEEMPWRLESRLSRGALAKLDVDENRVGDIPLPMSKDLLYPWS
jgi:hypothetical protein